MAEITGSGIVMLPPIVGSARVRTGDGIRIDPATSADIARTKAIEDAVLILALAKNKWLRKDREILQIGARLLIDTLITFALNARRFLEISKIKELVLTEDCWKVPENIELTCKDGWKIINRVVHHKRLEAIAWDLPVESEKSTYRAIERVLVESDLSGKIEFCPVNLATAFIERSSNNHAGS